MVLFTETSFYLLPISITEFYDYTYHDEIVGKSAIFKDILKRLAYQLSLHCLILAFFLAIEK